MHHVFVPTRVQHFLVPYAVKVHKHHPIVKVLPDYLSIASVFTGLFLRFCDVR